MKNIPDPRKKGINKHIISGNEEIADGVYVISFERKYEFIPGQIVAITLDEDDMAPRLYSICSGKQEDEMSILFNVVPGGKLTSSMAALKPGDSLFCSSPYGRFQIGDEPAIWIASGTGIAPFVSKLVSELTTERILLHGGRDADSFYFNNLLSEILGDSYIKCSSSLKEKGYFQGRVTQYLSETDTLPMDHRYYLCGSTEMVVEARDILISRGLPFNMIESEIYF